MKQACLAVVVAYIVILGAANLVALYILVRNVKRKWRQVSRKMCVLFEIIGLFACFGSSCMEIPALPVDLIVTDLASQWARLLWATSSLVATLGYYKLVNGETEKNTFKTRLGLLFLMLSAVIELLSAKLFEDDLLLLDIAQVLSLPHIWSYSSCLDVWGMACLCYADFFADHSSSIMMERVGYFLLMGSSGWMMRDDSIFEKVSSMLEICGLLCFLKVVSLQKSKSCCQACLYTSVGLVIAVAWASVATCSYALSLGLIQLWISILIITNCFCYLILVKENAAENHPTSIELEEQLSQDTNSTATENETLLRFGQVVVAYPKTVIAANLSTGSIGVIMISFDFFHAFWVCLIGGIAAVMVPLSILISENGIRQSLCYVAAGLFGWIIWGRIIWAAYFHRPLF